MVKIYSKFIIVRGAVVKLALLLSIGHLIMVGRGCMWVVAVK